MTAAKCSTCCRVYCLTPETDAPIHDSRRVEPATVFVLVFSEDSTFAKGTGSRGRSDALVTFKTEDLVRVTFHGKTVTGEVLMASENGLSLTLILDDQLNLYSRLMPVLWLEDNFVDLLLAEPVTILPMQGL